MKHICIRITAYVLVLVMFSASIFSAYSLTADAKGSRDLYGTGTADDIDITKLLDMALNKGGMSMSPSTIKAFLEYWWDSVASDINTCIGNASSAITTTQDFADYIISALNNAEHYDKLGEIIKRYVQYVLTLDYKSLSDFKQLLTQEGTFRKFLLSYVVDEDGNIAGTVDNKLKRYSLKSDLVNMVRQASDYYISEHESYFLIKSHTVNDISVSSFFYQQEYTSICNVLRSIPSDMQVMLTYQSLGGTQSAYRFTDFTNCGFVSASPTATNPAARLNTYIYNSNWTLTTSVRYCDIVKQADKTASDFTAANIANSNTTHRLYQFTFDKPSNYPWLYTSDGRLVKIWKSLDAYKKYTVNKQDIYYTDKYSDFDTMADNTINFNYSYYATTNYSHIAIQNNIDNSQEINETTINNIVNNYITNNYYGTDNSGGDGSGSGSGDDSGISQLLAVLVDGLAALADSVGKLLDGIENLFMKLFVPAEGFADPIKDKINTKFYFIGETHSDIVGLVDRFDAMGNTVPTVTFPLSKTPLAKYGVSDITVSFDWFEPYRVGFQLLISAIMWAMFLFNQFFGLKNLIRGTDSAARNIDIPGPDK